MWIVAHTMDARTGAADYDASSSSSSSSSSSYCVGGAIVVVAKCPLAGSCKTRLVPLLGEEGAACLARAMLSDVLTSISECVSTTYHTLSYYTMPSCVNFFRMNAPMPNAAD